MRLTAIGLAVVLFFGFGCASESDRYVENTRPLFEKYGTLIGTFNTAYGSGLMELEAADLEEVNRIRSEALSIEEQIGKNRLPVSLSGDKMAPMIRESRNDFLGSTRGVISFLDGYKNAAELQAKFMQNYNGLGELLGEPGKRKRLSRDEMQKTYTLFEGYKLTLKDISRRVLSRLERAEIKYQDLITENERLKKSAKEIYGLDVPDVVKIDVGKLIQSSVKTYDEILNPLYTIKELKDFQKAYSKLELK